eukprot:m.114632 g.114632  ORF g.114632 m.114632 type:complete len:949 (-) comp9281_c4_seq1:142-2988(-)
MSHLEVDTVSPRASPRLKKADIGGPSMQNLHVDDELSSMPEKEELDKMFRDLMENMNVSAEHEQDLLAMTDERKWKLVKNNARKRVALPPDYFATQLSRHLDPEMRKKKIKKERLRGMELSFDVLKKLEVALRTNEASWVEEFCDVPNNGHTLIFQFLEDIPAMIASKNNVPILAKSEEEHHLCILCTKALMKHDYGFRRLLQEGDFLYRIVLNLDDANPRTRVTVMQILAIVANNPSGGAKSVLSAFHYFSGVRGEKVRFRTAVKQLEEGINDEDVATSSLACFLSIINNATDLNMLVYFQMDLILAGLDELISKLKDHYSPRVAKLANDYSSKILNVEQIVGQRDENRELYLDAREKGFALQRTLDDVTKHRDELRELHKEAQIKAGRLDERLHESHAEIEALTIALEKTSEELGESKQLIAEQESQIKEIEQEAMLQADQLRQQQRLFQKQLRKTDAREVGDKAEQAEESDASEDENEENSPPVNIPPAPPLPSNIPAPPPLPPSSINGSAPPPPPPLMNLSYAPPGMMPKSRIQPKVPLPMLNWVPLRNVTGTIFEELDDSDVLNDLDFGEFESEFKRKEVAKVLDQAKLQRKRKEERISVLEANRAQNLVITVRRINLDYEELRQTVLSTDLTMLPAEHAELLLNYAPELEDIAALEKHKHQRERFAEAERFMFEMLAVDRYESRLKVIAYIGYFDDLVLNLIPQIESVFHAAEVLVTSKSFKKVLEVILAFGNYMNSAKRGSAYGFKLATFDRLLNTRSHDKKQTLLHFIVHSIEQNYPQIERFLEELAPTHDASRVSLVTVTQDVKGLRKGIDLILYEREKQQNNFIVHSFYANAVHKVARIAERYKNMVEMYRSVCTLYNENPEKIEPFEFFSVFSKFIHNYKKAKEDNHRRDRMRAIQMHEKGLAPGQHPNSLIPMQHTKNDEIDLPSHPILGVRSKRL